MSNEIIVMLIGFGIVFVVIGVGAFLAWRSYKTLRRKISSSLKAQAELEKKIEVLINEKIVGLETLVKDGFIGHVEAAKKIVEFMKDGFDGQLETSKQLVEASAKHSESVMKLGTDNSQKLYDTLIVSVQMQNMILQGLGYQPKDDGIRPGPNYGAPPAPKAEEGLTIVGR